jgi:hypothetical protein
MPDVIELRVHGVGGTPPESLLGESYPDDLVRTGGDGKSAFFARLRDRRRVEGYAWGPLTSSGLIQPLWIFLLPFTLLNVSGWTLPSRSEAKRPFPFWGLARLLISLLGVLLTLDYVIGLSVLVTRQLFYEWRLGGRIGEGRMALLAGSAVIAILGAVTFLVARKKQREFEEVRVRLGPGAGTPKTARPRGTIAAGAADAKAALLPAEETLADQGFWAARGAARTFLWLHIVAAAGMLLFLAVRAWGPAGEASEDLNWRGPFLWLGWSQAILLATLLLVCFGFKHPFQYFVTGRFRMFAPVVMITTAIGLTSGIFSGSVVLLTRALGLSQQLELDFNLAFGAATLSAALMAVLLALHLLARSTKYADAHIRDNDPPLSSAGPGEEPNGVPEAGILPLARARAFSEFGRHADLLLTVPAIVFALVSIPLREWLEPLGDQFIDLRILVPIILIAIAIAFHSGNPSYARGTGRPLASLIAVLIVVSLVLAFVFPAPFTFSLLTQIGSWVAVTGTAAFIGFWVRGYFKPERRRLVAILWDVLTFFPRRFHPLAVRPYSERAVPELVGRLLYQLKKDRRVILSSHSQGTVLAFAALMQLGRLAKERRTELLANVALVTYGSPLSQLHARFFPAYFNSDLFADLEAELVRGTATNHHGNQAPASWHNFFRLTDYIGKKVFIVQQPDPYNEEVPDPPEEPQISDIPLDEVLEGRPDPFRSPWVGLSRHSYYNSEPALKDWLKSLRELLATSRPLPEEPRIVGGPARQPTSRRTRKGSRT